MKRKWFFMLLLTGSTAVFAQEPVVSTLDSMAVKTLFFAGLKEKLNENYPKAAENFDKLLKIDPNNSAAYFEVATLNFRQNKLMESEMAIKKATSLSPQNLWYWKLLAELYKRKGDMDNLVLVFDRLIALAPDENSYYFDRSNALLLAGKEEEALKGYDILEKKFGSSDALTEARQRINIGKDDGLDKKTVEKILAEDVKDVKSLLYTSGVLMQKNQNAEALAVLKKAKQLESDNFEVDLAMADVYGALKNNIEAQASLKKAFENSMMPVDQKVKVVMMLFGGKKNQLRINDAIELATIASKIHPDDPKVFALYGDVLYQQGDLQAALVQFQSALKITDQLYVVWEQVLNIQTSLGLYRDVIKTADDALSVYPNQAVLYYYMALGLQNDNQSAAALTNIKMALQLDAENPLYVEYYGDILFLKGDKDLALVQWKKAKIAGNDSEKLNKKINEKKYIQ
ncbi:lipopolysaccharide assembly protein LapB [Pedobacter foliorum]|uniref:tetratricopeptide repeat protein n=1 Tax=Pedobacter foliorum TaxID=2739058 RepID=UPI0015642D9F|nr:tetratricopeptide repeat protein [Pedobacter foliorum]NRF39241.1 tetratricopeptide repeat protein [Pedobacter foliorum]